MRFDLGALIIILTLAFLAWASRKLWFPAKRQPGMRIQLSTTKAEEPEKDDADPAP